MLESLGKFKDLGLLVIRVGLGLCFALIHGLPKMTGGPETWAKIGKAMGYLGIHFLPVFWGFMASSTEAIGGLLILLGLFFRPTCIFMVITMFVAACMMFGLGEGFEGAAHAMESGFVFLGLLFLGPGKYSVDRK